MKLLFAILGLLISTGVASAQLPAQEDVFTIHTYGPPNPGNYVSNDLIYSALPSYRELPKGSHGPWQKYRHEQRGVIVTRDKRVFYFSTQDSLYLTIIDEENQEYELQLAHIPKKILKVPQQKGSGWELPLIRENIFCTSSYPWNITASDKASWKVGGKEPLAPEQFVESLQEWRPVTAADVPSRASITESDKGPVIVPIGGLYTVNSHILNGVIIMTNGAMLTYMSKSDQNGVFLNGVGYIRAGEPAND